MRAEFLLRAQGGDEDAFTELYAQHKKRVILICGSMVHDSALPKTLPKKPFFSCATNSRLFAATLRLVPGCIG
jgi:hypothetical protein